LSACTNDFKYIECIKNPIVEIIVANTNKLPRKFRYDGKPVIREPKR
jgi:hypothetical protein